MNDGFDRSLPLQIAICVPVRDEAVRLPRLLDAVEALDLPGGGTVRLCLLLDGCTDASASVADAYRRVARHPVHIAEVARDAPNAGLARGRAMRIGVEAMGSAGGILLTTDADSWPRADWLTAMVAALDHADIVAGKVVRSGDRGNGDQDRLDRYYSGLFALRRALDPVAWEATDLHHQTSGANMGMHTITYGKLGGFRPVPHGEDALLADDAGRAGLRVRRDGASVVHTSDRRCGRARNGLADALRDLDREGLAAISVAHPEDQAWQYRAHAVARHAFDEGSFGVLTTTIGLDVDHLLGVARDCPNAEAFAMRVVPVPPGGMRQIGLPAAEVFLATVASTPARAA